MLLHDKMKVADLPVWETVGWWSTLDTWTEERAQDSKKDHEDVLLEDEGRCYEEDGSESEPRRSGGRKWEAVPVVKKALKKEQTGHPQGVPLRVCFVFNLNSN